MSGVELSESKASERAATWLERMVQVLLGVVLGQAFIRNSQVVIAPFDAQNRTAALGLAVVFYLGLSSWLTLARVVSEVPYNVDVLSGRIRFYSDVLAVILYAYLLVSLEPLSNATLGHGTGSITGHLVGYPLVFAAYTAASLARKHQEQQELTLGLRTRLGKRRPDPALAARSVGVLLAIVALYPILAASVAPSPEGRLIMNQVSLLVVLAFLIFYRVVRGRASRTDVSEASTVGGS